MPQRASGANSVTTQDLLKTPRTWARQTQSLKFCEKKNEGPFPFTAGQQRQGHLTLPKLKVAPRSQGFGKLN